MKQKHTKYVSKRICKWLPGTKSWLLFGVRKADGLKLMTSDEVVVDTYGGQVTFHSVKKSDEGRYACEAINDAGSDTGYIQLRVLGKMIIEAIIVIIIIFHEFQGDTSLETKLQGRRLY